MLQFLKGKVIVAWVFGFAMLVFCINSAQASSGSLGTEVEKEKLQSIVSALEGLQFGGKAYLDYSAGEKGGENGKQASYNEFAITRGYFTVKKTFVPWMRARMTTDLNRLEQGDNKGDYHTTLKYLYLELRPGDMGFLTGMKAEIGQGHMPWLDFEQKINPYRSLGKMFVERAGVFNSADLGASIRGNLGGSLDNPVQKTGSDGYTGKYGSWHLGVYNGPGYHESEENNNKVLEGRFSLRPLPKTLPGLQFSYFGLRGEGDQEYNGEYPDYEVDLGMISFQHPLITLTSQYFQTEGEKDGKWIYGPDNNALETKGYSFFGDFTLPVMQERFSLFGRYDYFDIDDEDKIADKTAYDMYLAGISYRVYKQNMLSLAYEKTDYEQDAPGKGNVPKKNVNYGDDQKVQLVWRLKF